MGASAEPTQLVKVSHSIRWMKRGPKCLVDFVRIKAGYRTVVERLKPSRSDDHRRAEIKRKADATAFGTRVKRRYLGCGGKRAGGRGRTVSKKRRVTSVCLTMGILRSARKGQQIEVAPCQSYNGNRQGTSSEVLWAVSRSSFRRPRVKMMRIDSQWKF